MSLFGLILQIRLEGAEPPPAPQGDWLWWVLVVSGALAAVSTGVTLWLLRDRAIRRDPEGYAFGVLARKLRLTGDELEAAKRLGEARRVPPVAFLVSPSAMGGGRSDQDAEGRGRGFSTHRPDRIGPD